MTKYMTRKDIAQLLECSVDQVRKGEKHLGLDCARVDLNPRVVRYSRTQAVAALNARQGTRYHRRLVVRILEKRGLLDVQNLSK